MARSRPMCPLWVVEGWVTLCRLWVLDILWVPGWTFLLTSMQARVVRVVLAAREHAGIAPHRVTVPAFLAARPKQHPRVTTTQ